MVDFQIFNFLSPDPVTSNPFLANLMQETSLKTHFKVCLLVNYLHQIVTSNERFAFQKANNVLHSPHSYFMTSHKSQIKTTLILRQSMLFYVTRNQL